MFDTLWYFIACIDGIALRIILVLLICFLLFVFIGDIIINRVVRSGLVKKYLSSELEIKWSVIHGKFDISNFKPKQDFLDMVNSSLPLPARMESLELEAMSLYCPIWKSCMKRSSNVLGFRMKGLHLNLVLDSSDAWNTHLEENQDKFKNTVKAAKSARILQVASWTMLIENKLNAFKKINAEKDKEKLEEKARKEKEELQKAKEPFWRSIISYFVKKIDAIFIEWTKIDEKAKAEGKSGISKWKLSLMRRLKPCISRWKKGKEKSKVPTKIKEIKIDEVKKCEEKKTKSQGSPPKWKAMIDSIINSFDMVIEDIFIAIRQQDNTEVGIIMNKFQVSSGAAFEGNHWLIRRPISLESFSLFVNTKKLSECEYILNPMTIGIEIFMSPVMSGIASPGKDFSPEMNIRIFFPNILVQLYPNQVEVLMDLLVPMGAHTAWHNAAIQEDERSCRVNQSTIAEYKRLFKEQRDYEKSSFMTRLLHKYTKKDIKERKKKIAEIEEFLLAKDAIRARNDALQWDIPSPGEVFDNVPETVKKNSDLHFFINNPIEAYYTPKAGEAAIKNIEVKISLYKFSLQVLSREKKIMCDIFATSLGVSVCLDMSNKSPDAKQMEVNLKIQRFAVHDTRKDPGNVFTNILDRNPECGQMFTLDLYSFNNGKTELNANVSDFSLVLVPDVFVALLREFEKAIEPSEEDLIKLSDEPAPAATTEVSVNIYKKDLPPPFSPLLLGGMDLNIHFAMKGVELCLIGNPSKSNSAALALSSDIELIVLSDSVRESIVLQLEDVALQPCTVTANQNYVDTVIPGIRSILELEGEGVDFELGYELEMLRIPEESSCPSVQSGIMESEVSSPTFLESWEDAKDETGPMAIDEPLTELSKTTNLFAVQNSIARCPAKAKRRIRVLVHDFSLNLMKDDVALLLKVAERSSNLMTESPDVTAEKSQRAQRVEAARAEAMKKQNLNRIKASFDAIDIDGGGSLDADEIRELLANILTEKRLTTSEFEQAVNAFMLLVDKDGGGDVSFDEFKEALDPDCVHYELLHSGYVVLQAREFVNETIVKNVPRLACDSSDLNNASKLKSFWTKYTEETSATETSLNGQNPELIQKKMVRAFKNYNFAKEAWNRLVNPSLEIASERSAWLLQLDSNIEGIGSMTSEIFSKLNTSSHPLEKSVAPTVITNNSNAMYVQTEVSTEFGGFFIRVFDALLPPNIPSLEFGAEAITVNAEAALFEGFVASTSSSPQPLSQPSRSSRISGSSENSSVATLPLPNFGTASIGFTILGNYYNSDSRHIEPLIEPYTGTLLISQGEASPLTITYNSPQYFYFNVTSAFMDAVNATLVEFSSDKGAADSRERQHIKELNGIFWLKNDLGVPVNYWLVTEKHNSSGSTSKENSESYYVDFDAYSPCIARDHEQVLREQAQQTEAEKKLRRAFRLADEDGNGTLSVDEVEQLLKRKSEASGEYLSHQDIEQQVKQFMKIADTEKTGTVSWQAFKNAVSETRTTVRRTISIQLENCEPITNVLIDRIGIPQLFQVVPALFPPLTGSESVNELYVRGKKLYSLHPPTVESIAQASYLFQKVHQMSSGYEKVQWFIDACQSRCNAAVISVELAMSSSIGLTATITSSLVILNDSDKVTEILLMDENKEVHSSCPYHEETRESFCSVGAHATLQIPLPLINSGFFAIRQVGETEWSNELPLSTQHQQQEAVDKKNITFLEKADTKKSKAKSKTIGTASEVKWSTLGSIDGQPTVVLEEKRVISSCGQSKWIIAIKPQFILDNILPCSIEYIIAQVSDKPSYDEHDATHVEHAEACFKCVSEVNARKGIIHGGKSQEISGLRLDLPAFMKLRIVVESDEERSDTVGWSVPFVVPLHEEKEDYISYKIHMQLKQGPTLSMIPQWNEQGCQKLLIYAPYWIQNKSGLELDYNVSKGHILSRKEHIKYFKKDKQTPHLVKAPMKKALLYILPVDVIPPEEDYFTKDFADKVYKYLPVEMRKCQWSEGIDITAIGSSGVIKPNGGSFESSYNLAYDISAGPGQFNHTKIITIYPRYVFRNYSPLTLGTFPVHFADSIKVQKEAKNHVPDVRLNEAIVVYHFEGYPTDQAEPSLEFRNSKTDAVLPYIPFKANEADKPNIFIWSNGIQEDGPLLESNVTEIGRTLFMTIKDSSKSPALRIENRSTIHSVQYAQNIKKAKRLTVEPTMWHSFSWENPYGEKRLKIWLGQQKSVIIVDMNEVGRRGKLSPDKGASFLFVEVYIDGPTRVISFSDASIYNADRITEQTDSLHDLCIDVRIRGFGLTIVDSSPTEVLNLTVEDIRFCTEYGTRELVFSIHHFQIDDMTPSPLYPVLFAPLDRGFKSDHQEGWVIDWGERPFFHIAIDMAPGSGIMVFNKLAITLGSMVVKLNLNYLMFLGDILMRFAPDSTDAQIRAAGILSKKHLLEATQSVPLPQAGGSLFYFEEFSLAAFEFHLEFNSNPDEEGVENAAILGDSLGAALSGVAHITPSFSFKAIKYEKTLIGMNALIFQIIKKIASNVIAQFYQIFLSFELLGDPAGLVTDIVQGVALSMRQMKREIAGKSEKKGQSVATLMQAIIGAPCEAVGKITNGFGDIIKRATHFPNQEEKREPQHLPEGLVQGSFVLVKSIIVGVTGIVSHPVHGAQSKGCKGFGKGVGYGVLGLVACPFVGVLGAVEKIAVSLYHTTHLMDEDLFEGQRRPARDLKEKVFRILPESNVITKMEVYIEGATNLLPNKCSSVAYIYLYDVDGSERLVADRFRTRKIRRNSNPSWKESKIFEIENLSQILSIVVFQKRPPLSKKMIGKIDFTMHDIYDNFERLPNTIYLDPTSRAILRKQKSKVEGSVVAKTIQTSENRSPSGQKRLQSTEEEGELMDQITEISNVKSFPLICSNDGKSSVRISVRYINDLRC